MFDKFTRCKMIVQEELVDAGQTLDDDVINKVVERIVTKYRCSDHQMESIIKTFIEHKLYKGIITNMHIKKVIDEWVPIGLFPDAPDNEYNSEILMVQQYIKNCNGVIVKDQLADKIKEIFETQFGSDVFAYVVDDCRSIAVNILKSLENDIYK